MCRWAIPGVLMVLAASGDGTARGDHGTREGPGVVISFSHSSPGTAYWRRYAPDLERRPLDGVVFEIDPRDATWLERGYWTEQAQSAREKGLDYLAEMYERPREHGSISWGGGAGLTHSGATSPWNPASTYTDSTLAPALADLLATAPTRFTFNLVSAGIMSPTTDWFNDADFAQRCRNFAAIARFAKRAGLQGILFDDEQYGEGCVWNYTGLRSRDAHHGKSFEELRAKARERGRALAAAVCAEFPDIVFWTLHGYSTTAHLIESGLPEYALDLKPGFYDGLLEGASEGMVFVDGGEIAYGHNTREQFEFDRRLIVEEPIRMGITRVPELHRRKVRCGFGIWPDYYGKIDPENPDNGYFSPGRLQRALNLALQFSDGYVWLWGEGWSWWVEGPDGRAPVPLHQGRRGLPVAYWQAVDDARGSPGSDTSPVRGSTTGLPTNGRNYCVEGDELSALMARCETVFVLPREGWTFKLDEWGNVRDDPGSLDRPIRIGETWDRQGFEGDGSIGFYRLEFELPAELAHRTLHFYLPDVAGSVWLASTSCLRPQEMAWRYIGLDPAADRRPFVLTHPEFASFFFEPGKPAVVVIKVQGLRGNPGGIMAGIQVLAER